MTILAEGSSEAARLNRLRQMADNIPACRTTGIECVNLASGGAEFTMEVPSWLIDVQGVPVPGSLGVLVDTALGSAIASEMDRDEFCVTTHIHIEFVRRMPEGTRHLRCWGTRVERDDRFGFSKGEVITDEGDVIATATLGSLTVQGPPLFGYGRTRQTLPASINHEMAQESTHSAHPLIRTMPVHEALGTRLLSAGADGVRTSTPGEPRLANYNGGVHGGFGLLIGERALALAVQAANEDHPAMRAAELRVAYLRPLPADGSYVLANASMVYLGRRIGAARGEVSNGSGSTSVLVDATYVSV